MTERELVWIEDFIILERQVIQLLKKANASTILFPPSKKVSSAPWKLPWKVFAIQESCRPWRYIAGTNRVIASDVANIAVGQATGLKHA